jgi:hypothetical protein
MNDEQQVVYGTSGPYAPTSIRTRKTGGLTTFLIERGIVSSETAAIRVLFTVAILALGLSAAVLFFSSGTNSKDKSVVSEKLDTTLRPSR